MGFLYTLMVRRPSGSLKTAVPRKASLLSFSVPTVKRMEGCWLFRCCKKSFTFSRSRPGWIVDDFLQHLNNQQPSIRGVNGKNRNAPISAVEKTTNHNRASCFIRSRMTSRPHCLKKTSSMQSKRRNLHHTWLHRETNEKLSFYCHSSRWITTTFSTKQKI